MYKFILAFRYMFKRRISYLAFAAVVLCVFIVVVVMTVMTGLVNDFKEKNHRFVGDCVVGTDSMVGFAYYEDFMKVLEGRDFIAAVSPVIKNYGLLSPAWTEQNFSVELLGIDPLRHGQVTGFGKTLFFHKDDVPKAFAPDFSGCVLGIDVRLVRNVSGTYSHGTMPEPEEFTISCVPLTARGSLAKAGAGMLNTRTFYYTDTSQTGLARIDGSVVYLALEQAQLLCGMDGPEKRANAIHIKFKPQVNLDSGCEKVALLWKSFTEDKSTQSKADLLANVRVQSWKQYNRASIAAMEKELTMLTVMFSLVGITTVFIVLVVFYMIISHKSKDIGILKSVGVSNWNIIGLFSCFALLLGFLASCAGTFLGWIFLLKINRIENWLFEHYGFQLWDRTIYAIGDIPNKMDIPTLVIIIASAIAACLLGALIPSWQAARLKPVETLQVTQL